MRKTKKQLEDELEEALTIAEAAKTTSRILYRGIKDSLGLANWPQFGSKYNENLFSESVVFFLKDSLKKVGQYPIKWKDEK